MKRKSGILLHISSLPGKYGIGTMGDEARRFVDFLKETNQTLWQVLPLSPAGYGNSPYSSLSAFAGNPLFIDLDILLDNLNNPFEIEKFETKNPNVVEYGVVQDFKIPILKKAAEIFINQNNDDPKYIEFKNENSFWLEDFAVFVALKEKNDNKALSSFDVKIRKRDAETLEKIKKELSHEIQINQAIQYFFYTQWQSLKEYANKNNVKIIGDIPLYIAADSSDFWTNPKQFIVDKDLNPTKVAGVPPDYFSKTGQLWGNPLYNWTAMKADNYSWWMERLKVSFKQFDILRIDHFRGLSEFWAVAFKNKTAQKGEWLSAGGVDFIDHIVENLPDAEFIAEDLGLITPDVVELRERHNMPGMKILQFAFGGATDNSFLPFNFEKNTIVYTGTHDNDTSKGWYKAANKNERANAERYFGKKIDENNFANELIRTAFASVANTAIIQLQDLLNLDSNTRMNMPGTSVGDWEWRFELTDITTEHIEFLKELTFVYGRNVIENNIIVENLDDENDEEVEDEIDETKNEEVEKVTSKKDTKKEKKI